ncbi:MAG: transcriptional regulator [Bacteroidetes bacterium]|nr:transcriptional regulator [Bacteroidota bacterium]
MNSKHINILLADDDADDCLIFERALRDYPAITNLITVNDGEQLMKLLETTNELPHVLFLDFNMPCKNGLQCLVEIKQNDNLKHLPVIVYSTSFENDVVDQLFENGAHYFIRKLPQFPVFKKIIQHALTLVTQENSAPPLREHFVLLVQNNLIA